MLAIIKIKNCALGLFNLNIMIWFTKCKTTIVNYNMNINDLILYIFGGHI